MKSEPLVKEVLVNAPVNRVWQAITDKNDMKQWYFDLKDFKAQVGFEFSFEGGPPEKKYLHLCKVTEVIPEKKITYSWRYDGYTGESFVTFELFAEGKATRVRLSHAGIETFPPIDAFKRENFNFGWTSLIEQMLKDFVEKN